MSHSAGTICLDNVCMTYDGRVMALKPVSLELQTGRFNVLLGRSGAGKSTLLRCLNHLNVPTGGRITIEGLGTLNGDRRLLRRHRHRTAMIFQQHQLIGRFTALQNVLVGRIGHYSALRSLFPMPRKDQALALECLERVGLLDKAMVRADHLSGGQQQRVGIARGLAQQPGILLADEPVASLDPATAQTVLALLHRICREDGMTTVVSLHQVELARKFADRVIGLAGGGVVFDGPGQALSPEAVNAIYHGIGGAAEGAVQAVDVQYH